MSVAAVFVKSLREAYRRPKTLAITLGLPLVFMAIFGFAFSADEANTYEVGIVDQDGGALADAFAEGLAGVDRVQVTAFDDQEAARQALQDREVALAVLLPPGFTEELQGGSAHIAFEGDPSFSAFGPAHGIVEAFAQNFASEVTGATPPLRTTTFTVASQDLEPFDFIAPGLMVFAILNLAPQAAATLTREAETGSLDRVRLSPMRAPVLLGGVSLAHLALAAVSLLLMLLTAEAFGFHNQGSFLAAYGIMLVTAFSVIGIGMVIAALSSDRDEAANYGVLFSVPASFLSGAFFPLPEVALFDAGGVTWTLYDVLPPTHAVVVMRSTLTFGEPLGDSSLRLIVLLVSALVWFAVGAGLYAWRRLRAQE